MNLLEAAIITYSEEERREVIQFLAELARSMEREQYEREQIASAQSEQAFADNVKEANK